MINMSNAAQRIMAERFGRDSVIALATDEMGMPHVRFVNAYYEDGAFYIITHARSAKMRQIATNARVAIAGDWFTGQGMACDMGSFAGPQNSALAQRLMRAFSGWIDNGHTDLKDPDTIILRVMLTQGTLLSHGTRHEF